MATPPLDEPALAQDAEDRRAALDAAVRVHGSTDPQYTWQVVATASHFYAWLRYRDTLKAAFVFITPGTPFQEGNSPMDTTFSGTNDAPLHFSLSGVNARGAQVPVPADTWFWALSDPDNSGATLAVAGDALSADVTPGNATANLVLSVSGTASGDQAQCAITITDGAAVGVEIVPPAA